MKITNTTEEVHRNPLVGFVAAMLPGGIESQEAQGQRELVASEVLPVKLLRETREQYEALGFIFGDVLTDDPLFQKATLPKGWTRQTSNHSMWCYIVDDRGLKRVKIFYKAAFYDRSAHMGLCNVGRDLASDFIWGSDAEPTIPTGLTPEEIEQARSECTQERECERKARADKFLQALK